MGKFRITYRTEVFIEADTKDDAIAYFEYLNLDNLEAEQAVNNIAETAFVEMESIEKDWNE